MTRGKKGVKKNNNKPEEASTKAMNTSKQNKDSNVSFGDIQEMYKPPTTLQAPSNSPQNMAEKKGEDAVLVTTHPVKKVATNANEKMIIKDIENSTCDSRAEGSSKKKRKRRRGKSTLDNSGSEPVASVEHGAQKSNSSKRAFDKDTDGKLEYDNKAVDYIKEIAQRISEIESKSDETRTFIKKPTVVKKRCSPSEKGKQEIVFCTKEEKIHFFPNDDRYVKPIIRFKDSEINIPLRPVIIVTDKATQTDPTLDPPSISKPTDGKNSTVQKPDSDTSVKPKQKELTLQFPVEELKPENASKHNDTCQSKTVSYSKASSCVKTLKNITSSKTLKSTVTKPEPPSISESTDFKNSTTVISDSDGSVVNKPNESTLRFPAEEMQPQNVSADTSTLQNKNESSSYLSSSVKALQSLTSTRSSKSTEPGPPSISKSTDGKNSTVQKSDSDNPGIPKQNESTLQIPVEETKPENALAHANTFQDKTVSYSNASSRVEILQNITGSRTFKSTEPKTEPPSISEATDCKNSTTVKSDSDGLDVNEPNESTLRFPSEEMQPQNVSADTSTLQNKNESSSYLSSAVKALQSFTSTRSSKSTEPEPPSISKSTDGKNSATLKSDPDISFVTKPLASALYFPAEEVKPENVSEDAATFQKKVDSVFNMENIQSLTEEFSRTLGIISKDLEDGFIQSLKRSK